MSSDEEDNKFDGMSAEEKKKAKAEHKKHLAKELATLNKLAKDKNIKVVPKPPRYPLMIARLSYRASTLDSLVLRLGVQHGVSHVRQRNERKR